MQLMRDVTRTFCPANIFHSDWAASNNSRRYADTVCPGLKSGSKSCAAHPSTTNYSRLLVFFRPRAEKPRQPAKAIIENFLSVYSQYKYVIFRLEKMCVAQRGIAEEQRNMNTKINSLLILSRCVLFQPRGFLMIAMIPIYCKAAF